MNYKHALMVVSHDRSILNEVCTDIMEFKNRRLTYYKGNDDAYVKAADENIKNQMRSLRQYRVGEYFAWPTNSLAGFIPILSVTVYSYDAT